MTNLDLYAKIEPLIGFDEAYENLYELYLDRLNDFPVKTVLDVGCGNGNFLLHLQDMYEACGIDLSSKMVDIATKKGVKAQCKELKKIDKQYDALTAVADVLNYMDKKELKEFLSDVESKLVDGGVFVCDINTLLGFEEVTAGSMSVDTEEQFLSIEAEFEDEVLETTITLFESHGECYTKEQDMIIQYYHDEKDIQKLTSLELISVGEVSLFADESDKKMLIFQKKVGKK